MVKKTNNQETATALIVDENELSAGSEENKTFTDLSSKLAEIRKDKGVIGVPACGLTIGLSDKLPIP